jgi:hypothetical protein
MFDIRSVGSPGGCKADFGDQARVAREQGQAVIEDIMRAIKDLCEHMPQKSPVHNGLEIIAKGQIDEYSGEVTVTVRTLRVAPGGF